MPSSVLDKDIVKAIGICLFTVALFGLDPSQKLQGMSSSFRLMISVRNPCSGAPPGRFPSGGDPYTTTTGGWGGTPAAAMQQPLQQPCSRSFCSSPCRSPYSSPGTTGPPPQGGRGTTVRPPHPTGTTGGEGTIPLGGGGGRVQRALI